MRDGGELRAAGQDDHAEFAGNAERLQADKWPAPVVAFYLGRIDVGALRAVAAEGDEKTQRLQACHADFYLGVYALEKGPADEARKLLQAAADGCPASAPEAGFAKSELGRIGSQR